MRVYTFGESKRGGTRKKPDTLSRNKGRLANIDCRCKKFAHQPSFSSSLKFHAEAGEHAAAVAIC